MQKDNLKVKIILHMWELLFWALLGLKLFDILTISWVWVFAPIWIPLTLAIIIFIILFIYNLLNE